MPLSVLVCKKKSITLIIGFLSTLFFSISSCWALNDQPIDHEKGQSKQQSIDEILASADKIRSSSPAQFINSLESLSKIQNQMSKEQKHYFDYLLLYKLSFQGELTKALNKAKAIINSTGENKFKFRTLITTVNVAGIAKNWKEGLLHIPTILSEMDLKSNEHLKPQALTTLAVFYNLLGQYKYGLQYAEQLDDIVDSGRFQCLAGYLILEAKFKLNLIFDIDPQIQQAIDYCDKENELLSASAIRVRLAGYAITKDNPELASGILTTSLMDIRKANYPRVTIEAYQTLAQAQWLQNQYALARKNAQQVIDNSKGLETSEPVAKAYYLLYEIAKYFNEPAKALEYHELYVKTDKTHQSETAAKLLAYELAVQETKHKTLEQQTELELLDRQNKLLKAHQELVEAEAQNNRVFMATLVAAVMLLSVWIYRIRRTRNRLRHLAEYDSLTGSFTRGHFIEVAESALSYCKNTQQPLSLVLLDLDKFKEINDQFGHNCGDWVLKEAISTCRKIGRKNDIFARLGGEEFCILLPGCDINTAQHIAEQYRASIQAIDTKATGHEFEITASFGITSNNLSGHELELVLKHADIAMYQAKNNGRNRIVTYKESSMSTTSPQR